MAVVTLNIIYGNDLCIQQRFYYCNRIMRKFAFRQSQKLVKFEQHHAWKILQLHCPTSCYANIPREFALISSSNEDGSPRLSRYMCWKSTVQVSEKRGNGRFVTSGTECRTLKLGPAPGPALDQVQWFIFWFVSLSLYLMRSERGHLWVGVEILSKFCLHDSGL